MDLERHLGVVTAIYYISGGLTFSNAGVDLQVTNDDLAEGWHYTVTDTGTVIVKENNPAEWIVAIEYRDVATDKKDAAFER